MKFLKVYSDITRDKDKEEFAMRIWITGDTHGMFERIEKFCKEYQTTKEDLLIIAGDAGINYNGFVKDRPKKEYLEALPIRFLCVHGNHEMRPQTLLYYKLIDWCGGKVWQEEKYPSILFAKDGEIYNLLGNQLLVIGGAYSIDRYIRNLYGWNWWRDEQPSDEIKRYVEKQLEKNKWNVDIVVTHTCPMKYEPREVFLTGIDQKLVDKTTEAWLDSIEEKLFYSNWFCGHFHTEKEIDDMHFLFENYIEIPDKV